MAASDFTLTDRDHDILYMVYFFGGLKASTISMLLFPPTMEDGEIISQSNCHKRLLLLSKEGYLKHIEQSSKHSEGRKANIHILTQKGARELADHLGRDMNEMRWRKIDPAATELFLKHRMWINDVGSLLMYAVRHTPYDASLITWIVDSELKKEHAQDKLEWVWSSGRREKNTTLVPDAFVVLHVTKPKERDYKFFLELDRGTETGISDNQERRTWERKIRMYKEYFKEGGYYQKRYDAGRRGRVLTITTGEKRLAHLKSITEWAGGGVRYWFTTLERLHDIGIQPVLDENGQPVKEFGVPLKMFDMPILLKPIWQKASEEGLFTLLWE